MIVLLQLQLSQFCDSNAWNLQIKVQLSVDCDSIIPGVKRQLQKPSHGTIYELLLKIQYGASVVIASLLY